MATGNAILTDDGKATWAPLADDSGTNKFAYPRGLNLGTQNTEDVADQAMSINSIGDTEIADGKVPVEHGGPFVLLHMTQTPGAATLRVPVPPCASYVKIKAEGGTVRYKINGNATSALGELIEDGGFDYIFGTRSISVYAAAGVKVHVTAFYEQSSFRRMIAFQDFSPYAGFQIPLQRNTEIGNLAWDEWNSSSWSVIDSNTAEFDGAAPAGADAANAMYIDPGVTTGWFFGIIQIGTGDIAAGFVFRGTDVNTYNSVLLYPSDHSTKGSKIEIINRALGSDNILGSAIDSSIALTANTPIFLAVYVSSGNYAHVFVNGVYQGVQSIGTTHAGTKAGVRETGTNTEFANFGVCVE